MFNLTDELCVILLSSVRLEDKMKLVICIVFSLYICLIGCTPIVSNDRLTITEDFFPEEFAIYVAEHEIVSLMAPMNALNFDDDSDQNEEYDSDGSNILFFALADVGSDGQKVDKGLYILKKGVATKLLDNGRDTTAELGNSKDVYFGASDGIYKYNVAENKAEKYGSITDSVLQLIKVNGNDTIYILTESRELYKVIEEGTKKVKIDSVTNPKEIALDFGNNLYYIGADNKAYVVTADGVKEITGLQSNLGYVKLVRPPFVIENGLPFVSGDNVYIIYANGTSESTEFILQARPSAYAMDATLIQYYGYNKKIYVYNILVMLGSLLEEMKSYLQNFASDIRTIATRSRSDLRAQQFYQNLFSHI